MSQLSAEQRRLDESRLRQVHWKRWGPYLSEREWGTVREDYSPEGQAWIDFPFEHSHLRAYRWGEDGIAGICDRRQHICFALALWNGRDPILKERLFGLTGPQGNHGEDVKECYFYLDCTPTHSWMRYLYKYPQAEFPYERLRQESAGRGRGHPEFELFDAGVFDQDRYFDVFVEYAKGASEEILIRIRACNRGPQTAPLWLAPTVWFRNTWSWNAALGKPKLWRGTMESGAVAVEIEHPYYGSRRLLAKGAPELLFTENETNRRALYGLDNETPFVKDAFQRYLIGGERSAVNPHGEGTKAAAVYFQTIAPGGEAVIELHLGQPGVDPGLFDDTWSNTLALRQSEADEFYRLHTGSCGDSEDAARVQRQAFAGLLWSKQFYHFDVALWLRGDPDNPRPPEQRRNGRNSRWTHLYNDDVISMPDKWEYPWYAAWDLAFHAIPLALIDPDFAKEQLILFLREWYMHPNGQIPAYEWNFDNVNPPVHAWAVWRVYKIEGRRGGARDRNFLERAFHKLLLNFTWWVNRKDPYGRNVFEGGFMGLDNIGVFDRSKIPEGLRLEQADSTSWMAMYCLNMMAMAMELAQENLAYSDVASKFFEHFVYICHAMHDFGPDQVELWDEQDGFYYDTVHLHDGSHEKARVRSMVGLIPLFAVETLEPDQLENIPGFKKRLEWFVENRPWFRQHITRSTDSQGRTRRLLSIAGPQRLRRVLSRMLDENEFLSPYGVRSLSKAHLSSPYRIQVNGDSHEIGYEPGESQSGMFGGNSNWRGPVWFPLNYLLIEALQRFDYYLGPGFQVECPVGSKRTMSLGEVSQELSRRLNALFLRGPDSRRPIHGKRARYHRNRHWRDLILFHEYFHGEDGRGLGASHQTGWTALVAKLLAQSGPPRGA